MQSMEKVCDVVISEQGTFETAGVVALEVENDLVRCVKYAATNGRGDIRVVVEKSVGIPERYVFAQKHECPTVRVTERVRFGKRNTEGLCTGLLSCCGRSR